MGPKPPSIIYIAGGSPRRRSLVSTQRNSLTSRVSSAPIITKSVRCIKRDGRGEAGGRQRLERTNLLRKAFRETGRADLRDVGDRAQLGPRVPVSSEVTKGELENIGFTYYGIYPILGSLVGWGWAQWVTSRPLLSSTVGESTRSSHGLPMGI